MNKNLITAFFLSLILVVCILAADDTTSLFNVSIKYNQASDFGAGSIKLTGDFLNQIQYQNGTSTTGKEIDFVYSATGTVSSITPVTIDLAGLTNFRGTSLTAAKVKTFAVKNTDTTHTLSIGGSWIATESIEQYGLLLKSSPIAGLTVASSASSFIISAATSSNYEIFIAGIKN